MSTKVSKKYKKEKVGIAFEVENLDSLIAKLQSNQVTFKLDVFASPVCRMAVIIDSEGNAVTLHQKNHKD